MIDNILTRAQLEIGHSYPPSSWIIPETGDTQIQDVPKQGRLTSQGAGELHTLIWQACALLLRESEKLRNDKAKTRHS